MERRMKASASPRNSAHVGDANSTAFPARPVLGASIRHAGRGFGRGPSAGQLDDDDEYLGVNGAPKSSYLARLRERAAGTLAVDGSPESDAFTEWLLSRTDTTHPADAADGEDDDGDEYLVTNGALSDVRRAERGMTTSGDDEYMFTNGGPTNPHRTKRGVRDGDDADGDGSSGDEYMVTDGTDQSHARRGAAGDDDHEEYMATDGVAPAEVHQAHRGCSDSDIYGDEPTATGNDGEPATAVAGPTTARARLVHLRSRMAAELANKGSAAAASPESAAFLTYLADRAANAKALDDDEYLGVHGRPKSVFSAELGVQPDGGAGQPEVPSPSAMRQHSNGFSQL
jgi:hypothetical protein